MEAPRHLYRHAFQLRILLGERERERQIDRVGFIKYICPMPSCSEVLSLGFPQTSVSCFFKLSTLNKKEGERERAGEYHTIINK